MKDSVMEGQTMFRKLSSSNRSVNAYDKEYGTDVKGFFDYLRNGKKGEKNNFHIANAGTLLDQYGIKGKFMVGDFTFSATHTDNEDHNLGVKEWVDVINNLNNPLAITSYKGLPNQYRIYTYATINGKNICVGVNVSLQDGVINLSRIISAYGRDIDKLVNEAKNFLLYPATMEELKRRISQGSTTHNSWLNAPSSASGAKVIQDFENPILSEENLREGEGIYTDDDVVLAADPVSKAIGKPRGTRKQRWEFAERERQRMAERKPIGMCLETLTCRLDGIGKVARKNPKGTASGRL